MSTSPTYVSTTFTSPYGDEFTAGATIYWDSNFYVTVTDFWCDGLSDSEWTWRLTGSYSSGDTRTYASENSGKYNFQGVEGKTYVWGACAAINNEQAHYWTNTNGVFTLGSSSSGGDSGGSSGGGSSGGDEDGWDDNAPGHLSVVCHEGVSLVVYTAPYNWDTGGVYGGFSKAAQCSADNGTKNYSLGIYWNTWFRFGISALPGYSINENDINITGMRINEEEDAYWYTEATGTGTDRRGASITISATKISTGGDSGNTGSGDSGSTTTTPKIKIYIDNGSEFVEYYAYIDNGSSWDPVGGGSSSGTGVTVQKKQSNFNHTGSMTVNCGFKPDYVAFTLGEYYDEYQFSTAAVFVDGFATKAALSMYSAEYDEDCYIDVSQTSNGFSFYAYWYEWDENNGEYVETSWDDTFDYIAVKYT